MTDDFRSRDAVVRRLSHLFAPVAEALRAGIRVSTAIHETYRWKPSVDEHLVPHLVRREALEHLRRFHPQTREDKNLGLPMSGLVLPMPDDVMRIWRSQDGEIPPAASEQKREFLRQVPGQLALDVIPGVRPEAGTDLYEILDEAEDGDAGESRREVCNTVVLWDTDGERLTRLDLVLTERDEKNQDKINEVWRFDVLTALAPSEDVPGYGPRDEPEDGAGEDLGDA